MLIVISPAKTLKTDFPAIENSTLPALLSNSKKLATILKQYKPSQLSQLMGISAKLSQLNYERFQQWKTPYNNKESINSIFAFRGEVFNGINIDDFSEKDLAYTQDHLRIISGLYGILRPMDAILPYRLEMGTKIKIGNYTNLYQFWGNQITNTINKQLLNTNKSLLVNLASNEYFKSIDAKSIKANIITPVFKENKNGNFKVVSIYAKKARGLMCRYILKNRITQSNDIKHFDAEGYYFNEQLSEKGKLTFTR